MFNINSVNTININIMHHYIPLMAFLGEVHETVPRHVFPVIMSEYCSFCYSAVFCFWVFFGTCLPSICIWRLKLWPNDGHPLQASLFYLWKHMGIISVPYGYTSLSLWYPWHHFHHTHTAKVKYIIAKTERRKSAVLPDSLKLFFSNIHLDKGHISVFC